MSALTELCQRISGCSACGLARQRKRVVPGEGAENAKIVFIGEAPGQQEDIQGRPFVGPAGQFLDELLVSAGLRRSEVYICNVIKCRPPQNRDPLPSEIQACESWLNLQLELVKPRMVVTLGRYSMAKYFPQQSISKIHGRVKRQDGILYFPMYHPAAALHQQSLRQVVEQDMLKIPRLLAEIDGVEEEQQEIKPQQLTLF
ncbi:MAG: uracil-DNA glycosylase [Chloroflexi bacterium]|nr:uracil-DNA glycosylase [Chloroflexota bacterium]